MPGASTLARLVARVRDEGTRRLYERLDDLLSDRQREVLERLLEVPEGARLSDLERWRKGPAKPSGRSLERAMHHLKSALRQPERRCVACGRWTHSWCGSGGLVERSAPRGCGGLRCT